MGNRRLRFLSLYLLTPALLIAIFCSGCGTTTATVTSTVTSPGKTHTTTVTSTPPPLSVTQTITQTLTPVAITTTVSTSDPSSNFIAAYGKVAPATVIIEVQISSQAGGGGEAGTGWIIDNSGIIVTNAHVVANATTIDITLADGRKFTATAVKSDTQNDIAVIRINAQNLPVVALGDSSLLKPGQPVAAIGNSLDMGVRITTGVVSRLSVSITLTNNLTMDGMIETDTDINPGNSGGTLININGEVVGITNAGLTAAGSVTDVEGFGYAIPINKAMPVINSLRASLP